ncbi:MAG: hypothetical protein IT372_42405 [Polyangiaceae bacterium]|nr:hypothetical protein [Polyangiaceae bacterium]
MGESIDRGAARDDIMADAEKTHQNATAKGGVWKEVADQRIGPTIVLYNGLKAQLAAASAEAGPLTAQLAARNRDANTTIGNVADAVWNAVGRPGHGSDPVYAILFPGGITYYTDGALESKPERMAILAQLLTSGLHSKLPLQKAQDAAAEVTAAAGALRAAIEAARAPAAREEMFDRITTAVAQSTALEISSVKRVYKSHRFSEAEIHTVIPDRPRSRGASAKRGKAAKGKAAKGKAAKAPAEATKPEAAQPPAEASKAPAEAAPPAGPTPA